MKYTKRTTTPEKTNKNFIHTSKGGYNSCIIINKTTGSVLPNCVGYAWGRWHELLGKKPTLSRGNAETWYAYKDGYKRGTTPKLGAVACWRKGSATSSKDGAGHVAIVEDYTNDSITVSQSNYGGKEFEVITIKKPYNFNGLTFQGFIYNPVEFTKTQTTASSSFLPKRGYFKMGDTSSNIGKISAFMYENFPSYTPQSALGSYFGKNLRKSIIEFQTRTGLEPDGNIGKYTLAMLVKYGFKY